MSKSLNRRLLGTGAAAVLIAVSLAACSATSTPASTTKSSGIPKSINLVGIAEVTGTVSFVGVYEKEGWALAIDQIQKENYLGKGVKLNLDIRDAAFSPQTASSELTSALAAGNIAAIAGPSVSSESLAVAPIANSAGVPIVYSQSGVTGLLTFPGQYRVTAPNSTIWPVATDHIIKSGAKSVSIVSSSTNPTYSEIGTKTVPDLLKKGNVKVASSFAFDSNASDFQSAASSIVNAKPDVVVTTLTAPQVPTFITQLRQAGFTGDIYSTDAIAGGGVKTTGKAGVGTLFPTTFASTSPSAAKFDKLFEAKYNKEPIVYDADAYNQIWMIARGIKAAGSAKPADIITGLNKVAKEGFVGASGTKITFVDNDARLPGVLVKWNGTSDVAVK